MSNVVRDPDAAPAVRAPSGALALRVVRVLPDEPGLNKTFDYVLAPTLDGAELVDVGTVVRFPLNGRRMGGWIVAVDVEPATAGEKLRALTKVSGLGPPSGLFDLAVWASWRWWGRPASFLRTASPERAVRGLPFSAAFDPALLPVPATVDDTAALVTEALAGGGVSIVRVPPAVDTFAVVLEAARHGGARGALVIAPSRAVAVQLARRLRRTGVPVALLPDEWARARAGGCVVVGARAAAWAPIAEPGAIVVLDAHDEVHAEERMPTWNAGDVAVERARRGGVPCLLVSSCPSVVTLAMCGPDRVATWVADVVSDRVSDRADQVSDREADRADQVSDGLAHRVARLVVAARGHERGGWPPLDVIDRSGEQPGRQGLLSAPIGAIVRAKGTVLLVLNRTGRSKMLACRSCGQIARCERCGGPMEQDADTSVLACGRCGDERPVLCLVCGSGRLNNVRMGVSRAREEIQALAQRPVAEVTADTGSIPDGVEVLVGTEALLHRVDHADAVVFLDFDSELLAPRYRAAEQALALLVRAGRLVGGRVGSVPGRVVVQTRLPRHEVLLAAVLGDPDRLAEVEMARREALRFPPFAALAAVSGAGAAAIAEQLRGAGVELLGPAEGPFLIRAADHNVLCDALAGVERPVHRVRVEVDPLRI